MSKREPEVGDLVVVMVGCEHFYSAGDKARLLYIGKAGDWWGDFTMNNNCYGSGKWCLGPETDFEVIEDE